MSTATATPAQREPRPVPKPIPFSRIVSVELRKCFDTRAGFWLLASIGIFAALAVLGVILFGPDRLISYSSFATAIGVPMNILLPMVAILSVTGEWSQRSGLTTFTLVPHRGRSILAKFVVAVAIGVVSMVIAMGIGALGNLLGAAISGLDPVWNVSTAEFFYILLAQVLSLMIGFMLGVLIRNSPGAIVGYFVYSFVLSTITGILSATQQWFEDLQPWVDFNFNQTKLFDAGFTGTEWLQLGLTGLIWLVIPLVVGVTLVLRSEVK